MPDPDFNDDGIFDLLDIDALVAAIASQTNNPAFDLTGDGIVDLADRDARLAAAGKANLGAGRAYLLGDANLDGRVDGSDFGIWNANKFTSVAAWSHGDFNANGVVDGSDFGIWNGNKFTSAAGLSLLPIRWQSDAANPRYTAILPSFVNSQKLFEAMSFWESDFRDEYLGR